MQIAIPKRVPISLGGERGGESIFLLQKRESMWCELHGVGDVVPSMWWELTYSSMWCELCGVSYVVPSMWCDLWGVIYVVQSTWCSLSGEIHVWEIEVVISRARANILPTHPQLVRQNSLGHDRSYPAELLSKSQRARWHAGPDRAKQIRPANARWRRRRRRRR